MILSYDETKRLIDLVLSHDKDEARVRLYHELIQIHYSEPEFIAGVLKHGRGLSYTSDQWFDFLSKIPNILFQGEHWLRNKLSERQRQYLKWD